MGLEAMVAVGWFIGFGVYTFCHYKSTGMKTRNNLTNDLRKIREKKNPSGTSIKLFGK